MIIVAFHYRLPGDPLGQPAGCWKEFATFALASEWLSKRATKTDTSPKGTSVFSFKTLAEIPAAAEDWPHVKDCCPALYQALVSYIRYKKYER